jgi:hypothetical protein
MTSKLLQGRIKPLTDLSLEQIERRLWHRLREVARLKRMKAKLEAKQ